jgi:hypothetical protein
MRKFSGYSEQFTVTYDQWWHVNFLKLRRYFTSVTGKINSSTFLLLLLTAVILYVTKSLIDTTKVTGYVTEALLRNINNKPSCCFVFRVANLTDFVIETEIMLMCR